MTTRILTGDCRAILPTLDAESVNCCVTSPPYFGLRSYMPDAVRFRDDIPEQARIAVEKVLRDLGVVPTSDIQGGI